MVRILVGFVEDVLLAFPFIRVKCEVLRLILEVVVAEAMLEARHHCIEVLDVDFIFTINDGTISIFFVVDEYIGNLFSHFG